MAQPSVDWAPSDPFGLGANFHEQNSSSMLRYDSAHMLDAAGNVQCETGSLNGITDSEAEYDYCNATPAIGTDLGEVLTAFAQVAETKVMTEMTITFQAGQYAKVSCKGHQHSGANAHTTTDAVDFSAAVPASAGFGVPTWTGMTVGANATPVSATLTLSVEHVDRTGADGNHFTGKNLTPRAELVLEFIGTPTTVALTNWTIDEKGGGDANVDPDSYTVRAHRYFDLT
jgi:hypothetical protein